jgi:hypothetical protein
MVVARESVAVSNTFIAHLTFLSLHCDSGESMVSGFISVSIIDSSLVKGCVCLVSLREFLIRSIHLSPECLYVCAKPSLVVFDREDEVVSVSVVLKYFSSKFEPLLSSLLFRS